MKGSSRHDFVYKTAKRILSPLLKARFRMDVEPASPRHSPYILISNHVTAFDPLLVGMSFAQSMYYVASDHLFRLGWLSSLLHFLVAPIARAKATTETQTVLQIFRTLREGHNVCIFAEGNSTFNGETVSIPRSIAKLSRRSGVALITYRLRGGYFTMPRWSSTIRRGRMAGAMVREYSPEELKEMTDTQVYDAISRDLYVNAYEDQKADPVAFKGKNLAENLETALYCCPNCLEFSTLSSHRDILSCSCGLRLQYAETGYLEPVSGHDSRRYFSTILEWSAWQHLQMDQFAEKAKSLPGTQPILSDCSQILIQTLRATRNTVIARGDLRFFNDRLEVVDVGGRSFSFLFQHIADMSIILQGNIIFSDNNGISYEIRSPFPRSALKYLSLFRALTRNTPIAAP